MARETVKQPRKLVAMRLMCSQEKQLLQASKALGKSKTAIVEQAISMYMNQLRLEGVLL